MKKLVEFVAGESKEGSFERVDRDSGSFANWHRLEELKSRLLEDGMVLL